MKHFAKITAVYVSLPFPEEWGDPFRIVDKENALSLHDAVWERWFANVEEAMQPNGKSPFYGLGLCAIDDKTDGFDRDCITMLLSSWDDEAQLNKTIEWCEQRLAICYQDVLDCETI